MATARSGVRSAICESVLGLQAVWILSDIYVDEMASRTLAKAGTGTKINFRVCRQQACYLRYRWVWLLLGPLMPS